MADEIECKIFGDDMQLVEIELNPSEGVWAEVASHALSPPDEVVEIPLRSICFEPRAGRKTYNSLMKTYN